MLENVIGCPRKKTWDWGSFIKAQHFCSTLRNIHIILITNCRLWWPSRWTTNNLIHYFSQRRTEKKPALNQSVQNFNRNFKFRRVTSVPPSPMISPDNSMTKIEREVKATSSINRLFVTAYFYSLFVSTSFTSKDLWRNLKIVLGWTESPIEILRCLSFGHFDFTWKVPSIKYLFASNGNFISLMFFKYFE